MVRAWRIGIAQAQLPAAAQGPVDGDQVECDIALGGCEPVLLLHLGRFQVEDAVEIDGAGAILADADLGGGRGGRHAPGEVLGLLARLQEASQAEPGLRGRPKAPWL